MAKSLPPLAKSELEIARIVWHLGRATVRQVHEFLPPDRKLDFWTVQTYLRRLKAKGYLTARKVGQGNVYSSAVQPKRVLREVIDDFLDRVFDGEALPLFQQLIESRTYSEDEIQELEATFNRLKERNT